MVLRFLVLLIYSPSIEKLPLVEELPPASVPLMLIVLPLAFLSVIVFFPTVKTMSLPTVARV